MEPKSNIPREITNPLEGTGIGNIELEPLRVELNDCEAVDGGE